MNITKLPIVAALAMSMDDRSNPWMSSDSTCIDRHPQPISPRIPVDDNPAIDRKLAAAAVRGEQERMQRAKAKRVRKGRTPA